MTGQGHAVTPAGFDAWQADVSPDGRKLSYVVRRAGGCELWQTALPAGPAILLRRAGQEPFRGVWSRDSQRLGFNPASDSTAQIVMLPQGGGIADPLTFPAFEGDLSDWSPDGQWVVAEHVTRDQFRRAEFLIVILPLSAAPKAETKERLVTSSQSDAAYQGIFEARLSPDGRWIVFEAVKGGVAPGGATNATLCVVPVTGGPWSRITDGEFWDDKPRW